jgi:hypothetical protein
MKKWTKLAIPIVVVAVVAAWYAFRPERLVVNRVLTKQCRPYQLARRRSPLSPDSSGIRAIVPCVVHQGPTCAQHTGDSATYTSHRENCWSA